MKKVSKNFEKILAKAAMVCLSGTCASICEKVEKDKIKIQ